jgi:hypothetical protein
MKRRVYDIAGIIKVKVYLNGKLVHVPNFKAYAKMYLNGEEQDLVEAKEKGGAWQILACKSEG